MSHQLHSSERIVVVGGGFAGLSAAVRLAQAGLPVTVVEASKLGYAASTRNQGWLHSGAWLARTHCELARLCYDSLQQTLAFCPECIEPGVGTMIYASLEDSSEQKAWRRAWDAVGIPYHGLLAGEVNWDLPQLSRDAVKWTMRLPDRSFRPHLLLAHLAATARNAGAEIRANTSVTGLMRDDDCVTAVNLAGDEQLSARFVILATGAFSLTHFPELYRAALTHQSDFQLVCLKAHLRALTPGIAADPFCIVDGVGLNHLPHDGVSVFGTNRWEVVAGEGHDSIEENEVAIIEKQLASLFPGGFGENVEVLDWAGTTVQAMHVDQIEPGAAPLPTIIDHSHEPTGIENVISIFPGRATLWPQLAEQVRIVVLEKVGTRPTEASQPPWATST